MTLTKMLMALAACGCAAVAQADKVQLAKNGRPETRIVVAKDAPKAARFGAADLKWHLDHITGADFPIVTDDTLNAARPGFNIYVGFSKFTKAKPADFKPQQFLVDIRKDAIELVGLDKDDQGRFSFQLDDQGALVGDPGNFPDPYDEQGTLYAVYEFLSRVLGVIWVDPSDFGTYLPKNASLAVETTTRRGEPFIAYRGGFGISGSYYVPHLGSPDACEQIEFATAASEATRSGSIWRRKGIIRWQKHLFLMRHRVGGAFAPAGHSFGHWYDRFWEKHPKWGDWTFVERHADWFGKYPGSTSRPTQLCYSHPEVLQQEIQDARDYFDKGGYPKYDMKGNLTGYDAQWGKDNFCIEPNDGCGFCQCERCTKMYEPAREADNSAQSTYWFTFVAKVAEEVKKSHPDKKILCLAYSSHEGLPKGVKLPDNVIVYACLSDNRTFYGRDLEESGKFQRLRQWREAYPNQPLALWLYNGFPSGHYTSPGVPGFFARQAKAQYDFFKKLNVRAGIFHCGFNGEVDNYMQLEWMINPDRTVDELLTEYFRPYGKAGEFLRKFYEVIEERYCSRDAFLRGAETSPESCWNHTIRAQEWAQLAELMEKAEQAADTQQAVLLTRIWKTAVFDYMKKGRDHYLVRAAEPKNAWTAKKIADCGGDIAKVPWNDLEASEGDLYWASLTNTCSVKRTVRAANDGKWLYLEIAQALDTKLLYNSPNITPFDEFEIVFALQQGTPAREWFCSPDGRMNAASFNEMNMRWGVGSEEHGLLRFGARYASDLTKGDRWIMRWAFPLDKMLNRPVKPGDTLYTNATTVLGQHFKPFFGGAFLGNPGWGLLTMTSYTSVHCYDRMSTLLIGK